MAASTLLSYATKLVEKVDQQRGTDLEKKVKEATSSDNWGATSTLKSEIAVATHTHDGMWEVMPLLWKRIGAPSKQWQVIYKGLILLEHLIRHGAERVIDDSRDHLMELRSLQNFRFTDDEGKERGSGIRSKSKELCDLLNSVDELRAVRKEAKKNKAKYLAMSSEGDMVPSGMASVGFGGDFGGGFDSQWAGQGESTFADGPREEPSLPRPRKEKKSKKGGHRDKMAAELERERARLEEESGAKKKKKKKSKKKEESEEEESDEEVKKTNKQSKSKKKAETESEEEDEVPKKRSGKHAQAPTLAKPVEDSESDSGEEVKIEPKKKSSKKKGIRKQQVESEDDDFRSPKKEPGGRSIKKQDQDSEEEEAHKRSEKVKKKKKSKKVESEEEDEEDDDFGDFAAASQDKSRTKGGNASTRSGAGDVVGLGDALGDLRFGDTTDKKQGGVWVPFAPAPGPAATAVASSVDDMFDIFGSDAAPTPAPVRKVVDPDDDFCFGDFQTSAAKNSSAPRQTPKPVKAVKPVVSKPADKAWDNALVNLDGMGTSAAIMGRDGGSPLGQHASPLGPSSVNQPMRPPGYPGYAMPQQMYMPGMVPMQGYPPMQGFPQAYPVQAGMQAGFPVFPPQAGFPTFPPQQTRQ
eukprot:gb/GEZN01003734.1/.p1 GENE.gb/GEZN01003734.1/~~gb/GEZN01003734.1/.p1  ORF type:complete len:637 (-),score=165.08 gb/GEZN01003734.1/:109-2019(-)